MPQKPAYTGNQRNPTFEAAGIQPLYALENGSLVAVDMPTPGAPASSFPLSSGIRQALRTLTVPDAPAPYLCVSMDGRALAAPGLRERMSGHAKSHGLAPSSLCLFFSDQDCLRHGIAALDSLISLKTGGFKVGLDIECLETLPGLFVERLPADVLRLGPLDAMPMDGDSRALSRVTDFTRYADNLLMTTAAAGVTSSTQVSFLLEAGISVGQGPFFSGTRT